MIHDLVFVVNTSQERYGESNTYVKSSRLPFSVGIVGLWLVCVRSAASLCILCISTTASPRDVKVPVIRCRGAALSRVAPPLWLALSSSSAFELSGAEGARSFCLFFSFPAFQVYGLKNLLFMTTGTRSREYLLSSAPAVEVSRWEAFSCASDKRFVWRAFSKTLTFNSFAGPTTSELGLWIIRLSIFFFLSAHLVTI